MTKPKQVAYKGIKLNLMSDTPQLKAPGKQSKHFLEKWVRTPDSRIMCLAKVCKIIGSRSLSDMYSRKQPNLLKELLKDTLQLVKG